ncbi:FxSxx-COOH system tetratricopeptide repeat protein [Actinoplanes sp. KI2]|uniref:FxSxx-COOH system tetratricopeptide repeat protein n=1 Tax=Actinoplanes sp. KI2 TaxID=2983315 RepID=UPI0021D57820|nr:FxSxx-COOH system tetratricopeptide repeat protein [Actinoplanes sp. KI2]MCU7724972.1 FxSxx-COOH system tetratricopeptide repeat protein [Actinoplanes sp. KI2]
MAIALPGTDRVPEGHKRELLVRLHRLYDQAGRPATRVISKRIDGENLESVSYETVSSLLRGNIVPSWSRLQSIVVVLARMSVLEVDVSQELVAFNELWRRLDSPELRIPPSVIPPAPSVAVSDRAVAPRAHGPLPDPAELFTGREQILEAIDNLLGRQPDIPLVLVGPVGSGKTQLAAEYVRRHRDHYAVTWWIAAEDAGRARESLLDLAHKLGGESGAADYRDPFDRLFRFLEQCGPYLLVFDGVAGEDIRNLIRAAGGSVLVTTRDSGWTQRGRHSKLEIGDLDLVECALLLRKQDRHMTGMQLSRILEVVGRSPAGVAEAARLYRERALSWEDLADRLANPANRALTDDYPPSGHLVDEIRSILARFPEDSAELGMLILLLGFGPGAVWRWMLQVGADSGVSPGVRRLLDDPAASGRAFRNLAESGLGWRSGDGERIEIPAIIRLVLRELLPRAYGETNRRDVVEILIAADPGHPENPATHALHRLIAPHVRPAGLVDVHRPAAYRTIYHQIRFHHLAGDLDAAIRLGREAEASLARQDVVAPADELALQIDRALASALRAAGQYGESYRLTERAMAQVDANTSVALDLARGRGDDLRIAGEYQRAYELDEQIWQQHAATYSDDDPRTLASRYNLSVSRRFLGRFREVAEADRAVLDRLRGGRRAGPRQTRWVNALAEDLYGLGRFADVVELLGPLTEAESGRELQRARRMTGVAFRRLGRPMSAMEQLAVCYQECVGQMGEQRELTLAACVSLGNALRDLGEFETAVHYSSLAVKGYAAAMGADNPLVHVARTNRAAVLLARGDVQAAQEELDFVYPTLTDRLGAEHPFAVQTAINRASAVAVTDPPSAWRLSRSAYRQAQAVFGDDHLDTLIAAAGYAADRVTRKEDDVAAPGLDEIVARIRRQFGPDHPLASTLAYGVRAVVDIEPPTG